MNIYSYTDHLGNVRLSYFRNTTNGSAEVLEENNYYAFGLRHDINILSASNSSYKYQYNGKELQTETGWNDYGWRQYMPEIGRWNGMDQLSENYYSDSPYAYVLNNPVMMFDPDGRVSNEWVMSFWNNSQNGYNTTWTNTGSSFTSNWGGSMDYNADPMNFYFGDTSTGIIPTMNIPGIDMKGTHNNWGQSFQNSFNSYMSNWNNINWWSNAGAMAYTGTLTLPTGGGASAGTWASISETLAVLAGVLRAGQWGLPLILNGDSSHARGYDIPLTGATDIPANDPQNNLYLYRNMRSIVGMPELGNSLNTLGVRSTDFSPNVTDSEYVFGSSGQGMSVTPGYGNFIPQTPFANPGKTTLFRIKATDVLMSGLGINIDAVDHANITPIGRMTLQQFRLRVQATAPLWKPIK